MKKEFFWIKIKSGLELMMFIKVECRVLLLLGKYDDDVKIYVEYVWNCGGVINKYLLIGCVKGIIKNKDR